MKRLNWINGAMWNDRMQGLAMTIRGLPIPVIAMVNGWCMGGGHELALWCDLVIASDNAVLGQTGARVGACPTVGATQYLPRIIGERLAREMIFCARRFSAKEAVEIGLINKCVPQSELRKETLLWCDLVIASDNAVLGQTGARVGACPTVGATQYLPRIIGERLAREMIFCARRFTAKEAVEIGLINKCVPQSELRKETLLWCETIKGNSPQTLRMTKKSLNFESDLLYASWQHGMELLAHVWGSEESLEGMNAFLAGRKPDFQEFRMRNKRALEDYLDGCAKDLNAPPSMRKKA
jgi:1,4-dihydroxy-2-naphthoyl-CoA synthase